MFCKIVLAAALLATAPLFALAQQDSSSFASLGSELPSPFVAVQQSVDDVDFGSAVSLSANGMLMAVGAPGLDTAARVDAGAVLLYQLVNNGSNDNNGSNSEYVWQLIQSWFGEATEGIGRYLWLSPDGSMVAVRRGDNSVQVFATTDAAPVGSAVTDCAGGAVQLTNDYLITSCDRFDVNRGKVQVHELNTATRDAVWDLVVEFEGDEPGDRFGWRAALDETTGNDGSRFVLTASAPNHNERTGLVRSFAVSLDGSAVQLGVDLTGQETGEQFGFSIAGSQSPDRFLAVGVPQASGGGNTRGAIRVFKANRNDAWTLAAEFGGLEDLDRLGRDVAISTGGERVAASTVRHAQFAGLVTVYKRVDATAFELLSSELTGQDSVDRFGNSVALSETGSILASGSINKATDLEQAVGSLRVFVDVTPFCSVDQGLSQEAFLQRQLCRSGEDLVTTREECSTLSLFIDGRNNPCVWEETTTLVQVIEPPVSVSLEPTASPSVDSESPDTTPDPTEAPLPWSLEGCPCDKEWQCIDTPLAIGIDLGICVRATRDEINLVSISNFRLEQGSNRIVVVDGNGPRVSSARTMCAGSSCMIRTPVDTTFFRVGRPEILVATGTIAAAFPRARALRGASRRLQESMEGDFSVTVVLTREGDDSNRENEEEVGPSSGFWIGMVFMIALIIGCCCCITAKKSHDRNKSKSSGVPQGKPKGSKEHRSSEACADDVSVN